MKPISETRALDKLNKLKAGLKFEITKFESRAKNCLTCATPGACCLDAHFVNVHISRLEAVAIRNVLNAMPDAQRLSVERRIEDAVSKYGLTANGDTFSRTFACPLFEKGVGCLVHATAKPAVCIIHACYNSQADLPPDDLRTEAERQIDALNTRTYSRPQRWLPLPLAIKRASRPLTDVLA